MVRVGWISHQWPRHDDAAGSFGLLPGRYAGGAEMLQDAMRSRKPDDVEIDLIDTRDRTHDLVEIASSYDRIVISSCELLDDRDLHGLAQLEPLVWIMSRPQPRWTRVLNAARPLVWAAPQMMTWFDWAPHGEVCSGWFDTSAIQRDSVKERRALWAARDHPQKGRINARIWARDHDIPLLEMTNAPREQVINAMETSTHFVMLPKGYDPCPTTVVEAEIAGCTIIANNLVGRVPVRGADAVAEWIEDLPRKFWNWI